MKVLLILGFLLVTSSSISASMVIRIPSAGFATNSSAAEPAQKAPAKTDAPTDGAPAPAPKPDEPDPERGIVKRSAGAFEGWTLLAPLNSLDIHLVDMDGKDVHKWVAEEVPGGGTYLLPNGHLLRCGQQEGNPRFHGGGIGGRIEEIDWDGNIVWDYELISEQLTQHHDLHLMPNGNLLVIAWEYHSPDEARARGRDEEAIGDEGLWSDVVYEVKPTRPKGGEVVWKWRTWDHLVQDRDEKKPGFGAVRSAVGRIDINADHRYKPKEESDEDKKKREERMRQMKAVGYAGGNDPDEDDPPSTAKADKNPAPGKPPPLGKDGKPLDPKKKDKGPKGEADWLHTNAIDYNPELDLILLSTPHLCEIWVINHALTTEQAAGNSEGRFGHGGDLLYRWGSPQNYGMGTGADRKLFYQHNPTWLTDAPADAPKGELRVLVFNNGSSRPDKEYSSVDELVLPFDRTRGFTRAADKPFGPTEPAWSYSDPDHFFSGFISGAQRLPNGNTLICSGAPGHIFEVTRDKKVVWDFWNPFGGEVEPNQMGGHAPPKALFRATRIPKGHPGVKL